MRLFLLVLMMVLTLLRGGVGDAMATQMAVQQMAQGAAAAAVTANAVRTDDHADCMEAAHSAPRSTEVAPDHCSTCTVCQACLSVALAVPTATLEMPVLAHTLPVSTGVSFASADLALGQKPPIS